MRKARIAGHRFDGKGRRRRLTSMRPPRRGVHVRTGSCRNSCGAGGREAAAPPCQRPGQKSAARRSDPFYSAEAGCSQCRRADCRHLRRDRGNILYRPSGCRTVGGDGAGVSVCHPDDDHVRRRDGRRRRVSHCARAGRQRHRACIRACRARADDRDLLRSDLHDRDAGLRAVSVCRTGRQGPRPG